MSTSHERYFIDNQTIKNTICHYSSTYPIFKIPCLCDSCSVSNNHYLLVKQVADSHVHCELKSPDNDDDNYPIIRCLSMETTGYITLGEDINFESDLDKKIRGGQRIFKLGEDYGLDYSLMADRYLHSLAYDYGLLHRLQDSETHVLYSIE